ncbi:MAG TPA: V-type ATP synthase subunit D, partial [Rubrivivax sp.]|nr:V-type ATP synthase subunit D [Rubrivivax sp.]
LLDEKRMLLAAEILAGLRRHRGLRQRWIDALAAARQALAAAVGHHGLDGVTTHPGQPGALQDVTLEERRLLGLPLAEARLAAGVASWEFPPAETSPEVDACRQRFVDLAVLAAEMAGLSASLRVMARDYVRTERRARALENVILPEIESDMAFVEAQLESIDQEESIRVREARRRM